MSGPTRGATITPVIEDDTCDTDGCAADILLAHVDPDSDRDSRVLCPPHRVKYLREVNHQ